MSYPPMSDERRAQIERIEAMPAGPAMDRLIAELRGHKINPAGDTEQVDRGGGVVSLRSIAKYSTDIRAANEVLDALRYNWTLSRDVGKCGETHETAGAGYRMVYTAPGAPMWGGSADTAPLAICRAILLAHLDQGTQI